MEGIPLVGRNLLLEQNEEHTDGDEELLEVPDLIGDGIVSRMVGDPGVEEEDERPDDKASDDGDFAEAFAGQAKLEKNGRGEIKNEEDEVSRVAERAGGGEEPDRRTGSELNEENPPASAKAPGASDGEGADDAEEEAACGHRVIVTRIMVGEAVDRQ